MGSDSDSADNWYYSGGTERIAGVLVPSFEGSWWVGVGQFGAAEAVVYGVAVGGN